MRPWATDAVVPELQVEPGLQAALGDAVELPPPRLSQIGAADVAAAERPAIAVARVAVPKPEAAPELGVSVGHPVLAVAPAPPPKPAPSAPVAPEPVPAPTPAPEPSSAPVAPVLVSGGPGPGGGSTAGGPEAGQGEVCEGDEYEITIRFDPAGLPDDEVEIVIRHLESDGSESELQLEGSLSDVGELVEQLLSEGACATVVLEPVGEEQPGEAAAEVPGAAGVAGALESALP